MIEFLLFFITGCVQDPFYDNDYWCNVQIYLLDSQNEMKHRYYKQTGDVYPKDKSLRGLHHFDGNISRIWILAGNVTDYSSQGCTVLWHELLHATGLDHKQMPYCNWSP